MRRDEPGKNLVAGDVDCKISIKANELLIGDEAFLGHVNQPQQFLQDGVFRLESELKLFELSSIEFST
jgi:hypothetical protein